MVLVPVCGSGGRGALILLEQPERPKRQLVTWRVLDHESKCDDSGMRTFWIIGSDGKLMSAHPPEAGSTFLPTQFCVETLTSPGDSIKTRSDSFREFPELSLFSRREPDDVSTLLSLYGTTSKPLVFRLGTRWGSQAEGS